MKEKIQKVYSKVQSFISKHNFLFMLIIIITTVIAKTVYVKLSPYDSLWVFGNIYKLATGKVIYKDVNIITTPIFYESGKVLFNFFGKNYQSLQIYNVIICTILYVIIYQILRTLEIKKGAASLFTISMVVITEDFIRASASYNGLATLLFLVGLLIALKDRDKQTSFIKQGIIIALIILTNQKMAAGYIISYIAYELIKNINIKAKKKTQKQNIKNSKLEQKQNIKNFELEHEQENNEFNQTELVTEKNKDEEKESKTDNSIKIKVAIKSILKSALVAISICSVFVLYELLSNNLENFISLCILGLKDFKQNIALSNLTITYLITFIITIVISVLVIKNIKDEKIKLNIKIMLTFATGSLVLVYPIFNQYHASLAIIASELLIMYALYEILKDLFDGDNIQKIINLVATILITVLMIINVSEIIRYANARERSGIFKGAIFENELKENVKNVDNYLIEKQKEGKNIVVVSIYAMFYTLDLNIDNYYFDMPLRGNFGKDGTSGMLEKLKNLDNNTIILIDNDETKYTIYQFQEELKEYVKQNCKYIEQIENFDVYLKSN